MTQNQKFLTVKDGQLCVDYSNKGYVYVMNAEGTNQFKIGRTTNINRRLQQLNPPQAPFNINLVALAYVGDCFWLETALHNYYSFHRKKGEWFEFNDIFWVNGSKENFTWEDETGGYILPANRILSEQEIVKIGKCILAEGRDKVVNPTLERIMIDNLDERLDIFNQILANHVILSDFVSTVTDLITNSFWDSHEVEQNFGLAIAEDINGGLNDLLFSDYGYLLELLKNDSYIDQVMSALYALGTLNGQLLIKRDIRDESYDFYGDYISNFWFACKDYEMPPTKTLFKPSRLLASA